MYLLSGLALRTNSTSLRRGTTEPRGLLVVLLPGETGVPSVQDVLYPVALDHPHLPRQSTGFYFKLKRRVHLQLLLPSQS
jgi:hypothetical protein